jgi:DNA gyrase/topoisomerase IV subunit B
MFIYIKIIFLNLTQVFRIYKEKINNLKLKTASERFVKLTPREHVLMRPDTYIGSIVNEDRDVFVVDNLQDLKHTKISLKNINYNSSFVKLFDEVITNASDHSNRTNEVTYIKINIKDNIISIENDGPGIPIVIHEKEKIYIPELLFGHLLTSENYDDTEERFGGGRNGIGIKSVNIFSKKFIIETGDGKKEYKQIFQNNMLNIGVAKTKKSKKNYVKVTYEPDFEKFGMDGITDDIMTVFARRAFDIAAYNRNVKVFFNNILIPVRNFKDYMKLYTIGENEILYEKINEHWEIGVAKSPIDSFSHVSMVNGIFTMVGGSHVNLVSTIIVSLIKDTLTKANKGINIRQNDVKNKLIIFINCKFPNPIFDNQTKENFTSRLNELAKELVLSDNIIKKASKMEMFQDLVQLSMLKDQIEMEKEMNKTVSKKVKIEKLVDANRAGTDESQKCNLYISEGDCLEENTKITVIRNEEKINIKIKDVKLNDVVITHNSNLSIISNISKKISKCVNIKLKNNMVLCCSENHRWYVYDKINDNFKFIITKDLNINKHKFIINKNVNFEEFIKIQKIIDIKNSKYDKLIKIKTEEIYSTNNHKFSVYNINEQKFEMVECQNLDINKHYLVVYDNF